MRSKYTLIIKGISIIGLVWHMIYCQPAENRKQVLEVTFQSAHIGGGGYITGIVQNPDNPDILYAQSDVGGVFKTINGGKQWVAKNNGMEKTRDHNTRTIAIDPNNPDILYRASGELRAQQMLGHIHQSLDGGENWHLLTDQIDFFGNGPTRMCGTMLAIHPQNSNLIIAAGYSKGIWISTDRGYNWTYKGLKGKRITFVKFNPFDPDEFYVGTMCDQEMLLVKGKNENEQKKQLNYYMDFPRGEYAELFKSSDSGQSFEKVYQTKACGFTDMVMADAGRVLLISTSIGVLRSKDKGQTFKMVENKHLPQGGYYQTINRSDINGTIYTAQKYGKMACPVFVSDDDGKTWRLFADNVKAENLKEYPKRYAGRPGSLGGSIAHILPDSKNPDKLYFSNFWGVNISYDKGKNFYGHYFNGLEMTCVEYIEKHPIQPDRVITAMVDYSPMVSDDYGENFQMVKFQDGPSRALTVSKHMPELMIWSSGRAYNFKGTPVYKTVDGGKSAQQVFHKPGKSFIQCLQEDKHRKGRFWMLAEGDIFNEEEAGVYRSDDFGTSWKRVSNPFPVYIKSIPFKRDLINRDFLPVIPYQFKNGSGTNLMLSMDAQKKDLLYVGEWTEGLYKTEDGANTWVDISEGLPFRKMQNNVLSCVYAHPNKEGQLYAGFWNAGLWKSEDFGKSWKKIYPLKKEAFNAVSISIDNKTMVMACTENLHSSVKTQLLISLDEGQNWIDIYDNNLGALNFNNVSLDAAKKRIYASTCGNGAYYIDY